MEFDLNKNSWFIRVNTLEEAIAVQDWAFSKGCTWSGKTTLRTDFSTWGDKAGSGRAIGCGHADRRGWMGQASATYWERNGHEEIFVTTKLVVDNVVYPEVETSQEAAIRELEETIAKAQEQIQALKEGS